MTQSSSDITELLGRWSELAVDEQQFLLTSLYDDLYRIARHAMAGEQDRVMLQPTLLVNEAYLRLIDVNRIEWQGRTHFLRVAGRMMRQILVDIARRRAADKRGAQYLTQLTRDVASDQATLGSLLDIDNALQELAEIDEDYLAIVEARVFGGASIRETAEILDVSVSTVKRKWNVALAWLYQRLNEVSKENL